MSFVDFDRNGAIGCVTLNRPERLNAISTRLAGDPTRRCSGRRTTRTSGSSFSAATAVPSAPATT